MIWYLLYPFRGTTEPPQLSPSHPLRRAFQAHGTATARHWLLSILLTIAISVLLCYPAVFQTDSIAATGLRDLPNHVWTSTIEVDGDRHADVEVRQVWVHGDYMKVLDRRVLRQALRVQQLLVGNGFSPHDVTVPKGDGCPSPIRGANWGYQSPLLYWNCSLKAIEDDSDLFATVNSQSGQQSALNLTLRPSTVFAGKSFANKKLRAADALVITLFDQTNPLDSNVASTWESRSQQLAQALDPACTIFPEDGQITRNRLYEVRFQEMTPVDDFILFISYAATTAYVLWRMLQVRAFKSRGGLLLTIGVKMTVCVIASFTICTYLGIDLGRIPRPWFPGVVFCFGLGNIFRLINVVLETPPEMPPVQRIGNALGEVGHLSLAVACQNLVIIYLCSRVVTPLVADFCVFAAVTLVLDFVFHLTFFVAVLSVDVQRMELQDSLARVDLRQASRKGRQPPKSWLTAIDTRLAGTVAIISMILAVNWHFFDNNGRKLSPRGIYQKLRTRAPKRQASSLWGPPPINQARTPAEWLKLQDHNTAREMVGFIKPNTDSFIARVYDPLLVVLNGAEGRDTAHSSLSLLARVQHFTHEHAFPAALVVVFLIAGVTLLMNYMLWTGIPDDAASDQDDEETHFSVKTLPMPPNLDVVCLATCPKGHIVSINLDRSTSVWLKQRGGGYINTMLNTTTKACTMDDSGRYLALSSENGSITLWRLSPAGFLPLPPIELSGQAPILFQFVSRHVGPEHDKLSLLAVTPDGYLTQIDIGTECSPTTRRICSGPILSATTYTCSKGGVSLVVVSKPGDVYILSLRGESEWTPEVVAGLDPGPPPDSNPSKIKSIHGASSLGLLFAIRAEEVEICGFNSRALIHTLRIGQAKPCTFRVMHSPCRPCACGAQAIHTLVIAYTEHNANHMIMHTYTLGDNPGSQICLGKPSENATNNCRGLKQATEAVHCVELAGVWESTNTLSVVGIRKSATSSTPSSCSSFMDKVNQAVEPLALASALKLRATKEAAKPHSLFPSLKTTFNSRHVPSLSNSDSYSWEAWSLSATGEFRCRPLFPDSLDDAATDEDLALLDHQLFVDEPGPIVRLGNKSVAAGFGNTVKIITLGKESFDGISSDDSLDGVGSFPARTRKIPGRKIH